MKIKNTKYILVLLAGIISLVSGCGCGKGGEGKGSTGVDPVLEATEKKLLDELKPLYLEQNKAGWLTNYVEAKAIKGFEIKYTDPETNSFLTEWRLAKGTADRGDIETMSDFATETAKAINTIKKKLDNPTLISQYKVYLEKKLELYKNRLKMIEAYLGIETKEDKK